MNILQSLESSIIGVGDNYLVLENVVSYADIVYTVHGVTDEIFNFTYTANDGEVALNLREITRLVYDNLENYQDPYDYSGDVLYTETDGYHYIKIDIQATDGASSVVNVNDIVVINAALDVGECLILTSLIDEMLDENAGKNPTELAAFAYELNLTMH